MSSYQKVVLAKRPTGDIIPGETFKLERASAPSASALKDGEVLLEARYLSLDPAMRGWLRDARSYLPPVQINEVMRGQVIGLVKASKSNKFPVGSIATGTTGWSELAVANEKHLQKVVLPKNGRLTDALSVLGTTGLTAYFGIIDVGKVKAGDFVVVSGAAGATGSVVGQIAKLKGATVLGIAGSDDKCQWLKEELGFDDALNYKDKDFPAKFRKATKQLIDVFFDNVGGEILDLALGRAKEQVSVLHLGSTWIRLTGSLYQDLKLMGLGFTLPLARFVMCGGISQYNAEKPEGPKNYLMIVAMRIRMEGFIVFDYAKDYPRALKEMAQWLEEGKIQRKETIVKGGLGKAEQALVDLYKGVNTGKLLVEVKDGGDEEKLKANL